MMVEIYSNPVAFQSGFVIGCYVLPVAVVPVFRFPGYSCHARTDVTVNLSPRNFPCFVNRYSSGVLLSSVVSFMVSVAISEIVQMRIS